MDKSNKYGIMCSTDALQIEKSIRANIDEGDYYYLGEELGVVVIGHDHLSVVSYLEKYGHYARFAMRTEPNFVELSADNYKIAATASGGKYTMYSYKNPVWCPKMDQWFKIIRDAFLKNKNFDNYPRTVFEVMAHYTKELMEFYDYYKQFDTMEQLLCAYYMKQMHDVYWWHSEQIWVIYSDAQKKHKEKYG